MNETKKQIEMVFQASDDDPEVLECMRTNANCVKLQKYADEQRETFKTEIEQSHASAEVGTSVIDNAVRVFCTSLTRETVLSITELLGSLSSSSDSNWHAVALGVRGVAAKSQSIMDEVTSMAVEACERLVSENPSNAGDSEQLLNRLTDTVYAYVNSSSSKLDLASGYSIAVVRLAASK
ncbi:hypothetical protein FVE85_6328 [Porphyridium purpureum]|uniref:Uncharacterized protein n=1 Tax=Porphyridium purpureum TaxID=35688 RepID=A0A5J4Z7D6_PORPP|nr:hypothetical protein FVE85_6328 [Porphyridium purpureum]|eukprot:POR5560..scf295_1